MKYNFDLVQNRSDNEAIKWEALEDFYGSKDLLPLWVADMDFKTSDEIISSINLRANQGIYGYTALNDDYFNAYIKWVKKSHDMTVKSEELIYSPGVVMSLILIIRALTSVGERILIQTPVYGPFKRSIEEHQRTVVYNPLIENDGDYQMDFKHLESSFKSGIKMMILCNPHNPMGRVWSYETLTRLSELVQKYHVTVISDEIHSDLILKGYKHNPLVMFKMIEMQVITLMSPSKTFNLAGLQSSIVLVKAPAMRELIQAKFEQFDVKINNCFGQVAFKAAYNYGRPWLDEALEYIENNMDYVVAFIKKHLHEIKVTKPQGTYLLWLDCRHLGFNQKQLDEFMVHNAKLALTTGAFFGEEGHGFMRMNVACSRLVLEKAMAGLHHAIQALRM